MSKVYDIITEQITAKLDAGTVPWKKPWSSPLAHPRNLSTTNRYRGINVFLLMMAGYESPYWITYRQATELGGQVRKGERSTPVIFWQPPKRGNAEGEIEAGDEAEGRRRGPVLRYYRVFNVAQCAGLEDPYEPPVRNELKPIRTCEAIAAAMPRPPAIRHREARAYYDPTGDLVNLPPMHRFASSEAYYATLFHELGHATGHASRLGRTGITEQTMFGDHAYSKEELVAEMTAAFLCGHAGIAPTTLDDSASYIAGWLKVLRNHRRWLITAAAQAQKAADYILATAAGERVPF